MEQGKESLLEIVGNTGLDGIGDNTITYAADVIDCGHSDKKDDADDVIRIFSRLC